MIDSPFVSDPPAVISFSGGRTSGLMLYRMLQAHGGALPADCHVVFTNTGKERPETLNFIQEVSQQWGVPIVWLEWRDHEEPGQRFIEVNHNTASRKGEPFAALVSKRQYLPNSVARFCTQELKIQTAQRWCKNVGIGRHTRYVGLRADEAGRVHKIRMRCETGKGAWGVAVPLYDAGITKADVVQFWAGQPFDLQLEQYEGNCDLCFLKSRAKLRQIMYESPWLADWWIEQEAEIGSGFRPPRRPNYQQLYNTREKQADLFAMDALDLDCACTD